MQSDNDNNRRFIEKRKYPRIPIKIQFECEPRQNDTSVGDGLLHFHTKDLCCGGIAVDQHLDFPPGSILHMKFNLPDNPNPIKVRGLVIRINKDSAGIRFMTLDINDFESIDNYVNRHIS